MDFYDLSSDMSGKASSADTFLQWNNVRILSYMNDCTSSMLLCVTIFVLNEYVTFVSLKFKHATALNET